MRELPNVWTNRGEAERTLAALAQEGIAADLKDYATRIHMPRFRYGIAVPEAEYKRAQEIADAMEGL